jgi:hypothetical protein
MTLGAGTPAQLVTLAMLRGLSVESIALASERGLLHFGDYGRKAAWFILDKSERVAQARPLDAGRWANGVKALNLQGSEPSWPVGIKEAAGFPSIALCEGGADLLAAFHFLLRDARAGDCAPVAMLGAEMTIHNDALPLFAGKHVRIFQHADRAGEKAGERWSEQLTRSGAEVSAFRVPKFKKPDGTPGKDLNDLAQIPASDFDALLSLTRLFP